MSIVSAALLKDLQRQAALVADDLREQVERVPEIGARLKGMHRAADQVGRTGETWNDWLTAQCNQAASSWVIACAFIRFCEDNDLTRHRWIASRDAAGNAISDAADAEAAWIQRNPRLTAREWLREAFTWLRSTRAGHGLFPDTDFIWWWDISADRAEALIAAFRRRDEDGVRLAHDFHSAELDTRFLGDLYQDLSEHIRKRYALLQTPVFVEEFILDLTLTPALDDFGLDGLKLIDPTCGSGHFLLGAFDRLLEAWGEQAPGLDERVRVQKVLDSVHGVDINPAATAITKFRLMVAALKACGVARLDAPDAPALDLNIATGDTLLYGGGLSGGRQMTLGLVENDLLASHLYDWEDVDRFPGILDYGRYHVVVGNPPYIQVKDKALNQAYRERYEKTCAGKYALSAPFAELFFRLAVRDADRPGYVGQITANSFMKREFGKKLIEGFFAGNVDLTHVIDTSGAYIPGHGTPTVILIGKNRYPNRLGSVRAVLGVRGEPTQPEIPALGLVWRSIVDHVDQPASETEYISAADMPRERLSSHPWSLSGGGAPELSELLGKRSMTLGAIPAEIGMTCLTLEDDVYLVPRDLVRRRALANLCVPLVSGDEVRDFKIEDSNFTLMPQEWNGDRRELTKQANQYIWAWRTNLKKRLYFGKIPEQRGLRWFDLGMFFADRHRMPLSVAFAFVATHNHFVLDRGGKVFNRTAPVIKLPKAATEDDYLRLLGLLNSSTACFWLKQVCHDKGNGGIGGGIAAEEWERFYEFTGTKLQEFPLSSGAPLERARRLDRLAQELAFVTPQAVCAQAVPTREALIEARRSYDAIRAEMIAVQEELDWEVYQLYGIVDEDLTYPGDDLPALALGQRAFEIVLGRKLLDGETDTQWFARHGSTPIREIPAHLPQAYRDLVQRRIEITANKPLLGLVERPECKRRWATEPYDKMQSQALRSWLLDRLEDERLWIDGGAPRTLSVAQLADLVRTDAHFRQVMEIYLGRPDYDVTSELVALLKNEHVPYLAAHRYTAAGLLLRQDWEHVWALQRQEDAGEKVEIPVPPKYASKNFIAASYWRHRGKLDVPKERFTGYPGAEREGDATPVYGWAGWDHLQQATALANLLIERAYPAGDPRAVPLLAGVAELESWLHQWYGDYDALYAASPAEYFTGWLETQLTEHGLTREALAAWRPEPKQRGHRAKKGA
ncbi:BREX-2 system adenine-specific DNA-methyltransferase PglX [Nonomuraea glycinis]|uniref:BREX-2 system adenine-specific DNA-methyltransferase PglX n=1 Tax=Nonomuraea glycinis TaxID=2047744 RepID=UPI00166553E4|nr:BREX-2 system adenine-specific DNA-methyltransferase PglX [Nonomuraea glycinis]MCA2181017.1 BREX-2 system adenine-specific DNA-methyltransferase PglX [Nonomuraea glycinis]